MDSSRYSSVRDQIITNARAAPYLKSTLEIVELMEKMRELVELHKPKTYKTFFTEQERKWLVELLCWESLFPDSKFPGKRPRNPAKQNPVSIGYMPEREQCVEEGRSAKDQKCPYVRMVSCSREEHDDYKVRLDMEDGNDPSCPACHVERMRELKDGWVFV
ncbi:hypothetical protein L207DRAFT_563415 [Hyaloscypha variabilis F]|uniref:Uncharacterized protein n=1 Tax=Hyaloscypha variabilis (strain UAMH 11265 / GT02V1 / F) TaxID=1149755 RepID=A0A2J6S0W9_HYAVF|nr:hypothetical protein L207DRAFT_563415 [Hyaloscypha variabilis F]